jgi:hypothetical protein
MEDHETGSLYGSCLTNYTTHWGVTGVTMTCNSSGSSTTASSIGLATTGAASPLGSATGSTYCREYRCQGCTRTYDAGGFSADADSCQCNLPYGTTASTPTVVPTMKAPTHSPTVAPTHSPTRGPSANPSASPTVLPSAPPSGLSVPLSTDDNDFYSDGANAYAGDDTYGDGGGDSAASRKHFGMMSIVVAAVLTTMLL